MAYYPWNVQALMDWLRKELANGASISEFSARLNVPYLTIMGWMALSVPSITLEDLRRIAAYRGWSFNQVVQWLELCPAHLSELVDA